MCVRNQPCGLFVTHVFQKLEFEKKKRAGVLWPFFSLHKFTSTNSGIDDNDDVNTIRTRDYSKKLKSYRLLKTLWTIDIGCIECSSVQRECMCNNAWSSLRRSFQYNSNFVRVLLSAADFLFYFALLPSTRWQLKSWWTFECCWCSD